MIERAILALADGTIFQGSALGVLGDSVGEVVFNTSMSGYQEILTDPSYAQQLVTLTYPHIGNVGCNAEDVESNQTHVAGLIIRDNSLLASSWRSEISLNDYLRKNNVVAIADIDTRHLTKILRDKGAQGGCIMSGKIDEQQAIKKAQEFSGLQGVDLASQVSTSKAYCWGEGRWKLGEQPQQLTQADAKYHLVVYDFGVKQNILRQLVDRSCYLTVVPAQTNAEDVLALSPDAVFFSNGPADPAACDYAIVAAKKLLAKKVPLFGICLGQQILALACGAKTVKMKFGHHGANHPVSDLATGRVLISSQNHGFTVDDQNLPEALQVTHRSLFDGTIQGLKHRTQLMLSFQGHPEASPGPHDMTHFFDDFIVLLQQQLASVCQEEITN